MNKDVHLLFEAYGQKVMGYDKLQPTSDLETIAKFLNLNEVPTGAVTRGGGGWYVTNGVVHNDDNEGGFYLSVKIKPIENGIVLYSNIGNTPVAKRLYFPVHASLIKDFIDRVRYPESDEDEESCKLKNMSPEEREAYDNELDKKEAYKQSLHSQNEDAEASDVIPPQQFMADVLKKFKSDYTRGFTIFFGEEKQGDKAGLTYALVREDEEVQEEDKRYNDSSFRKYYNRLKDYGNFGKHYDTSGFLSEDQYNALAIELVLKSPNLNRHVKIDDVGYLKGDINVARQLADKLTGFNHSDMMKSYAYSEGFEDEKNERMNNKWPKDILNHHFYDFGVYEAHTN